ncbi:hypothetical protein ACJJTC_018172 [Scirpophaga incertulas]
MAPKVKHCAGCSKKIINREFLSCSYCADVYDIECVNYSGKQFMLMNKNEKDNWKCPVCKSKQRKLDNTNTPVQGSRLHLSPDMISDNPLEVNITQRKPQSKKNKQLLSPSTSPLEDDDALLAIIRREIKLSNELVALRDIRNSMEFLSADYDRVKTELSDLQEKLSSTTKEYSALTNKMTDVSDRLNLLEQHARETNIEIGGVPENKSENLLSFMRQLCKVVSVPLSETDILTGTRVRKITEDSARPRSIIIKLQSIRKRDEILAAVSAFNKKNQNDKLNTSQLGYGEKKSPVYVSEHLSPYNKKLHATTRKAARDKCYKYVWIRNGRIFVRKDDQTPAKQIRCYDSLNNL